MKGKILNFRIGHFSVFVQSSAFRFPVFADRSLKNHLLAFGLGGLWDGRYQAFIFSNALARIHFCFLSGHWDEHLENDQSLWQFGHQQASARARMRDFYDEDFTPAAIELDDEQLNAIPF